ncbi:DNA-binding protein [Aeromonas allosaccharophila]|uniref:DNA-binding protein n=1 Tax=Aeromonas allosaccharophila TaxID=656 RepID=A0AAX3NYS2_9GAMM|nr:DNA-binding protein [Aeromonas allosaccharophila]WED79293.1 DNA-binding protein [Aeromonas allosaccharophila]
MNKSNVEDEKKGLSKEGHKNELINLSASERRELVISELKRKHRVLILMRGIPLHEFREIIDRLEAVYSELESDQKNRDELDKIRRAEAEKIIIDMNARGVDIQYLNEIIVGKSESDNAKYIKDGVPWSGQGRRPDVFKGLGAVELERYRVPVKS